MPDLNSPSQVSLSDQLAAAQAWWSDAGVEHLYLDEPQVWLKEPEEPKQKNRKTAAQQKAAEIAARPKEVEKPLFTADDLPESLEAFAKWWMESATPLPGPSGQRIAPRGKTDPRLMVLVPVPETGDRDELLSAQHGKLINNILRALQISPDDCYFASSLPTAMTMPDWEALARTGLGAVVERHVKLVNPKSILLLGDPLRILLGQTMGQNLGHNLDQNAAQTTNQPTFEGANLPAIAARAPEHLLSHPRQSARLWPRLLDWSATL